MERIGRAPAGVGQESVWDYPRPPRLERSARHVEVFAGGARVAESTAALRVLETSHPPVYYLPRADIAPGVLVPAARRTFCEFKGAASYCDVTTPTGIVPNAAWFYSTPSPGFEPLAGCVAFYPGLMDRCLVDGEQVVAQPGDFYGGWITSDIVGPFKGAPGTAGW
ncbi:MAG: DUF427 domain-containing protein [Candidatus Dormibacteraeota bacterium]|nr:DUF427 domain-containing protein [Candidatus Dormibacteraeota bacterium]